MENSTLIRKIRMDCPLCDRIHGIEERKRFTNMLVKGEEVTYAEKFYFCSNSKDGENEFETGSMTNENLLAARNAYRKAHKLLTSEEIIAIRESYGLSQVELARLLGWGEATISRYESKAIQEEAYDNMLRIIKDNPLKAIEFLEKNRDRFPLAKRKQIRSRMEEQLDSYGKEFLTRQALESVYVRFSEPSDCNGFMRLDIDKIETVITYYAERIPNLFKVKLMKMLWYADALSFKLYGNSITGLVYRHEAMGALPIGHYGMMNLENINMREEEGYDSARYHFYPNPSLDMTILSKEERVILDKVVVKFKDFSTPEIVKYMHEEKAYKLTETGEIIPYHLAGEIRELAG